MRAPKLLALLALAVAAPVVSLSLRATAEPSAALATAAPASAAAAGSDLAASASAISPSPPGKPTLADRLVRDPLPDKATPMPPLSAWTSAEELLVGPSDSNCTVNLIREWLHVTCSLGSDGDMSLLAGDSRGLSFAVSGEELAYEGHLVLPLRPGRSSTIAVTRIEQGRYSSGLPETFALLWVRWPEGEALPSVRLE